MREQLQNLGLLKKAPDMSGVRAIYAYKERSEGDLSAEIAKVENARGPLPETTLEVRSDSAD